MKFWIAVAASLALSSVSAAPPLPFEITYNAHYGSFDTEAFSYLRYDASTSTYQLQTELSLDLLGYKLISVVEESQLRWEADHPVPLAYRYQQEGLSARSRSIEFDHQIHTADFTVDDKQGTLVLDGPVFDGLSSYLAIREQLIAGAEDVMFEMIDKDTIKNYHYHVDEETVLDTALGKFTAVKLVRVREPNPERRTEIWLAKDHDFILLKLVHEEPGSRTIRLDVTKAVVNGVALPSN